ncbi:MAG: tRNA (N6-threonylcarbamoyladenosine(37)-N6)-methyltransferase TrmO [Gammaproteobacteria bacterium]|nr:tRNA (N6-threonylcarbamoyladenosine(37)-N6)-methyltransferase TrmO [Gammaproteobacteria bacterium]
MQPIQIQPIGMIHSCFKEKFATPRQPGLVPAANAQIELVAPYNVADAAEGLTEFSHIWLTFAFHQTAHQGWKPKVRPPRLGGNTKIGVFATRSTFRPNPLGLSLVRLESIDTHKGVILHVSGADLIDGTPILDIKPYLPWVESIPNAKSGFAGDDQVLRLPIAYSAQAEQALALKPELTQLIEQVLAHDPRPAYQQDPERIYGCKLADINLRWQVGAFHIKVVEII